MKRPKARASKPEAATKSPRPRSPKLLAGGNPQIAKADGEAPVRAFIDAMPAWKSAVGRRIDELVSHSVRDLRKAVKWNSPFYGVDGQGWFLSFHCFAKFVKVAFLRGVLLDPLPPGTSKTPSTRYLDIRENEPLDEAQFVRWVKQAAAIPGWNGGSKSAGGVDL